ncbi:MAG TPA: DUF1223 domain-containing protein [Pyrinomonadaceae bacterium]|jgi:hypothetical protein
MKMFLILSTLMFLVFFSSCSLRKVESEPVTLNENSDSADPITKKQPVLVELFTSEGCSSCPPADQALAFLDKEQPYAQAEIITLALHVDYWNNLGWRDEYSSPLFSQRQAVYAQRLKLDSAYTPQMIVDGRFQFVGSNLGEAGKAVMEAAKSPKAKVEAAFSNENILTIKVSDIPKHGDSTLFLALAEDNLASNVKRGENAGKNLQHVSVVRELKPLAKIEAKSDDYEQETAVNLQPEWKRENMKYVVFIQENESRKVLGIGKAETRMAKN